MRKEVTWDNEDANKLTLALGSLSLEIKVSTERATATYYVPIEIIDDVVEFLEDAKARLTI